MKYFAPLPIGTRIIAARDFGPIIKGQFGIVTCLERCRRGLWLSTKYVCTFLGNIRVTAESRHITECDHGYSSKMLENPLWFLDTRQTASTAGQLPADVRRSPN